MLANKWLALLDTPAMCCPQFYFRTADIAGTITLAEGAEMVLPGDNTRVYVETMFPVAMDVGLRFAVREGGRTVAAGVVASILD